jgi:hypothetical protein
MDLFFLCYLSAGFVYLSLFVCVCDLGFLEIGDWDVEMGMMMMMKRGRWRWRWWIMMMNRRWRLRCGDGYDDDDEKRKKKIEDDEWWWWIKDEDDEWWRFRDQNVIFFNSDLINLRLGEEESRI